MPAPLTRLEVARIAALARIELSETDAARLARELTDILAFAGQIADVDTRDVPPTTRLQADEPVLRADEPAPSLAPDEALANAPETDAAGRFVKVPRVLG